MLRFVTVLLFFSLWAGSASAQIDIVRETPSETPPSVQPDTIRQSDCALVSLELTATGLDSNETASVWVSESADCATATARENGECFDTGIAFTGTTGQDVTASLAISNLVEALPEVEGCRDALGEDDGRPFQIYLLVDVTGADTDNFAVVDRYRRLDLVGPPPARVASAAPIEDGLVLSFDGMLEEGTAGIRIFAEPASVDCRSPHLTAGEVPPTALAVAQRTTTDLADLNVGLEAGVRHAAATASTDALGNLGPLSEPICATPLEFAALESTGGCAVGGGDGSEVGWLALAALLVGVQRRRVS